jgi:hypothetical protein
MKVADALDKYHKERYWLQQMPKMRSGQRRFLGRHTSLLVRCHNSSRVWPLTKLESFLKNIIDKGGKGGGLMLAVLIPNNAMIKDIKAMMKSSQGIWRI